MVGFILFPIHNHEISIFKPRLRPNIRRIYFILPKSINSFDLQFSNPNMTKFYHTLFAGDTLDI